MRATIPQVSKVMQSILIDTAHELADTTGLMARRRKVNGANLSQTLVLGWLSNPTATLEELCQTAAAVGLQITPQGLDQRFTPQTAQFMRQLLEATIDSTFFADAVAVPFLQRFNGVYLSDSSIITLPDELRESWPGFGGRVQTSRAAMKLQVRLDMVQGKLEGPLLCAGRTHDRAAAIMHDPLPAGALHLADLGYWKLAGLSELSQQGSYWLTRLQVQTKIVDEAGQVHSQADFLKKHQAEQLDVSVSLGASAQVPARLLAMKVPPAVAAERRRRLKEQARSKGQPLSRDRLALADWTLLVTNLPHTLLTLEEALLLYRLRWQIELLFKLWKSKGEIASWRTHNPWRILCELYAKLIAMVFQHWLFLLGNWSLPDRSWLKATKTVRQHAIALALALPYRNHLRRSLKTLVDCLASGCRINKSRAAPRQHQLLLLVPDVENRLN